jgi:hypothetical protein
MANADGGLTIRPDAKCTSLSRMSSLLPFCAHSLFHNFIVWIACVWLLVYINFPLHISYIICIYIYHLVHLPWIPIIYNLQCLLLWLRSFILIHSILLFKSSCSHCRSGHIVCSAHKLCYTCEKQVFVYLIPFTSSVNLVIVFCLERSCQCWVRKRKHRSRPIGYLVCAQI